MATRPKADIYHIIFAKLCKLKDINKTTTKKQRNLENINTHAKYCSCRLDFDQSHCAPIEKREEEEDEEGTCHIPGLFNCILCNSFGFVLIHKYSLFK